MDSLEKIAALDKELYDLSEEIIANRVLLDSGVDSENVPIEIENVLIHNSYKIGKIEKFKDSNAIVGIGHRDRLDAPNHKVFFFKSDLSVRDRRYAMALGISYYIFNKGLLSEHAALFTPAMLLRDSDNPKINRVARALLMPQKSLSMFMMSPMIRRINDNTEKLNNVSKAFLVSNEVARLRLMETGLGL